MHRKRNHVRRQDLVPPVLSGIFGNLPTPSVPLGDATSILSLPRPNSATTSTGSYSTSFTSESLTPTSSPSDSTTSTTTATPTAPLSVYETTSGGSVHTITTFVDAAPSSIESVAPAHKSFLQNKALSGVVFSLAGLAGLIIIITIATFTLRRGRNSQRLREAVSFDPVSMNGNHQSPEKIRESMEKHSISTDNSHEFTTLAQKQEQGSEQGQVHGYRANYTPRRFGHHPPP